MISLQGATVVTEKRVEETNPDDSAANGTHSVPALPVPKSGLFKSAAGPDAVPAQLNDVDEFLHDTPNPAVFVVHESDTYGVHVGDPSHDVSAIVTPPLVRNGLFERCEIV